LQNSLKSQYESLRQDLQKLEATLQKQGGDSKENRQLQPVASQLGCFLLARNRLIEFYELACQMGATSIAMDFASLHEKILLVPKYVISAAMRFPYTWGVPGSTRTSPWTSSASLP
jgi:hypothetical protein